MAPGQKPQPKSRDVIQATLQQPPCKTLVCMCAVGGVPLALPASAPAGFLLSLNMHARTMFPNLFRLVLAHLRQRQGPGPLPNARPRSRV